MFKREKPIEKVVLSKIIKKRARAKIEGIIKEKSEAWHKKKADIKEQKAKEIEDKKLMDLEKGKFKANVHIGDQLWEWLGIK